LLETIFFLSPDIHSSAIADVSLPSAGRPIGKQTALDHEARADGYGPRSTTTPPTRRRHGPGNCSFLIPRSSTHLGADDAFEEVPGIEPDDPVGAQRQGFLGTDFMLVKLLARRQRACQPAPMPHSTGPGGRDPFDPWDLEDVRERVVMPVISSLIPPADLETVDVGWGPREPMSGFGESRSTRPILKDGVEGLYFSERDPTQQPTLPQADDELWLLVTAAGATWHSQLWQIESAEQLETMTDVAWALADRLEDWVCERVYWGEQPLATFIIPERQT